MIPLRDNIPSREAPFMVWMLIFINGLVFFFLLHQPRELLERLFYLYGIVPARYTDPLWAFYHGAERSYLPFITSMFLHGGLLHFLFNMWALWIFGDNVEDRMGHLRFLVFYLACGVVAGVMHFIFNRNSTMPALGASGAIAGVMGAYFLLYPHARIITFIPMLFVPYFIEVLAVFYIGVWFLMQFFSGMISLVLPGTGANIAWWAHVGGFVAGIVLMPLFRKRKWRRYCDDEWCDWVRI